MNMETIDVPTRCVTPGDEHFWFGYYDKFPWDATGRYLLAMRSEFADRPPNGEDVAELGRIDLENGNQFEPFAETTSWCWQQGCMMQWLPQAADRLVLYNVTEGDHFATVIHDLEDGSKRILPRSTYCVSRDGKTALCVNHARLNVTRPGYGYPGPKDAFEKELASDKDGVFQMDLNTGENALVVSVAQIAALEHIDEMDGVKHWFNHLQFNADDSRFVFLHRFRRQSGEGHITRLFTACPDGSDVYLLNPNRKNSHFDWRDTDHILVWARFPNTTEESQLAYLLFRDKTEDVERIGVGVLDCDGHCSFSPDRRWLLTDTYPDKTDRKRTLILYEWEKDRRINIGRYLALPEFDGDMRCDLHPRWSRDGRQVCFDSVHEGKRSMYVADVGEIVG